MGDKLSLEKPVTSCLSSAAFTLREELTIDEALATLRNNSPVERPANEGGAAGGGSGQAQVVYFYVLNGKEQLVGVLPARLLVLSQPQVKVGEIMQRDIIVLGARETLFDALELFAMHRLLAIPVVDADRRFLGIVELSLYTDEVFDMAHNRQLNEVFQLIGLRIEEEKQGSAWRGFRMRMPWLLSNITGGLICAALGAIFQETVQKVVLIALFIPLILTVAESVAVQSMTLAIEQAMAGKGAGFGKMLRQEGSTAILLGLCSGVIVGSVSLFWRGPLAATLTIGGALVGAVLLSSILGRVVPKGIHWMKLNPRVASGPITLAIVDIVTITLYLSAATFVLGR